MIEKSLLQLALARGVGDASIKKVMSFLNRQHCSWRDCISNRKILFDIGFSENIVNNIFSEYEQANMLYEKLVENNIDVVVENDKEYPQYLKKMLGKRCPAFLFISGNAELLNATSVGFCGSRKASLKGINLAIDCAKQLSEAGITVVSGYAAGTDIAVHKETLLRGGNTIFVLAEGILRYTLKKEVRELLTDKNHVFISQYMPDAVWNKGNAMNRNGTIIGLSRAMILIESGLSGGTFAAGKEALQVGCPLFVLDFHHPDISAEANPYFISLGGTPIRGKNGIPNLSKVFQVIQKDVRSEQVLQELEKCKDSQIKLEL